MVIESATTWSHAKLRHWGTDTKSRLATRSHHEMADHFALPH